MHQAILLICVLYCFKMQSCVSASSSQMCSVEKFTVYIRLFSMYALLRCHVRAARGETRVGELLCLLVTLSLYSE